MTERAADSLLRDVWVLMVRRQSCCDGKTSIATCRFANQPRFTLPAVAQVNGHIGDDLDGALGGRCELKTQAGRIKRCAKWQTCDFLLFLAPSVVYTGIKNDPQIS